MIAGPSSRYRLIGLHVGSVRAWSGDGTPMTALPLWCERTYYMLQTAGRTIGSRRNQNRHHHTSGDKVRPRND
jgi:hypothetical protein